MEQYGCVSCHNGNGRSLVASRAHGPVFDGQYEEAHQGEKLEFTEKDPQNDPQFAYIFNHKPGHELLFQTTPLFVGSLMESKCVQCHQPTSLEFQGVLNQVNTLSTRQDQQRDAIRKGLKDDIQALVVLSNLRNNILIDGYTKTMENLMRKSTDYSLPQKELDQISARMSYLTNVGSTQKQDKSKDDAFVNQKTVEKIDSDIHLLIGSSDTSEVLAAILIKNDDAGQEQAILKFYEEHPQQAQGALFAKAISINMQNEGLTQVKKMEHSLQNTMGNQNALSKIVSDVDKLTKTYQRGEELYISQACYACHRISAFSRGGVGPELTQIGNYYPWYIKGKIIWPQGDLKTSTMPNMKLDHEELEALVTFLLGQTGNPKSISDVQYQVKVKDWENGQKMPWENSIPPDQVHDLRNSMVIFATQGCASCHKLKGFESDVGYSIEADGNQPDFDTLYKEKEWFTTLFPENILGSKITEILDKHQNEIDQHIVANVRQGGILEEIEQKEPELLEAMNSSFRYALRAKNHEYQLKIDAEKDPKKKIEIAQKLEQWKARVRRVLMVYIQEYGLGRLIGPRLNWSGIFRSDKWLMDHFHNPTSTSPKSLMPVFPFDDSKFYALTYMLDELAKRNRNQVHEIWEHRGFNPELAFNIHCAQCHGDFKHGNGPVAEWIYPIPKNLSNATFLRNLTKERAIESITHGVKGTPMPPWGEVAPDKMPKNQEPVLTKEQISQLADWLYSSLSGEDVIEGSTEILKWQYTPEDALKEMQKEGDKLNPIKPAAPPEDSEDKHQTSDSSKFELILALDGVTVDSLLNHGEGLYAALKPTVSQYSNQIESDPKVDDIFDVNPPLVDGPDKHSYFIKRKYYTEENLKVGQSLFELNCSICHGKEADGSGLRAAAMSESKPRMLTNLNWLDTRDDIRLLRSIKYGVPGTAMTPWGDYTSTLQRMQLVMFIRSLSQDHKMREDLFNSLYQTFGNAEVVIDNARAKEYAAIEKLSIEIENLKNQRESSYDTADKDPKAEQLAVADYQKEIEIRKTLKERQEVDQKLVELKALIEAESSVYQSIGLNLLLKKEDEKDFKNYLKLILLSESRYRFEKDQLTMQLDDTKDKERDKIQKQMIKNITNKISQLVQDKSILEGKIPSLERTEALKMVNQDLTAYQKFVAKLMTDFSEAQRLRKQQGDLSKIWSSIPFYL